MEGKLQAEDGLLGQGLVWDLSRHGACLLIVEHAELWRGQEMVPSLGVGDVTPFIGPVLMRVGGRGHAAAPG